MFSQDRSVNVKVGKPRILNNGMGSSGWMPLRLPLDRQGWQIGNLYLVRASMFAVLEDTAEASCPQGTSPTSLRCPPPSFLAAKPISNQ